MRKLLANRYWVLLTKIRFTPQAPKTLHIDLERAVQRAMVEIWTLQTYGKPFQTPQNGSSLSPAAALRLFHDAEFKQNESGETALLTRDASLLDEVVRSLGFPTPDEEDGLQLEEPPPAVDEQYIKGFRYEAEVEEDFEGIDEESPPFEEGAEVYEDQAIAGEQVDAENQMTEPELQQTESEVSLEASPPAGSVTTLDAMIPDQSWREVNITDASIKFAVSELFPCCIASQLIRCKVIRRVMQLTGIRIPDPQIQRLKTAQDLLQCLSIPEKAPKLAAVLKETRKGVLTQLPNVQLNEKRVKPVDKDRELGREKLIRAELERRNLPFNMKKVKEVKRW